MRRAGILAGWLVVGALIAGLGPGRALAQVEASPFTHMRAELASRAAEPWSPQHCAATETGLDRKSFAELNAIRGLKLVDRPHGWSVEARVGGRPFHCFTTLRIGAEEVHASAADFDPSPTAIARAELEDHFVSGKQVNRLWFLHSTASGDYPVTVVFTADGFMVVGGARSPMLLGTTLRTGVIGEPFGDLDYAQHVEDVVLRELGADTLELTYRVDSEAAVAAVEATLRWDPARAAPTLAFRTALVARTGGRLGFVGGNALRGPVVHGLLDACGEPAPQGGIAAFHDVRSAFVALPDGRFVRDLLVPPLSDAAVSRTRLVDELPAGGRVILDQSQHVPHGYFSRHPGVAYRDRADVVITLVRPPPSPVSVERAQVAVDLGSTNPEANETVNVYLATELGRGELVDVEYTVDVAAADFAKAFDQLAQGVVFVDVGPDGNGHIALLPVDDELEATAEPQPLTGPAVVDPRRPSASADGRWIAFDAEDVAGRGRRGVHILDRRSGDVRRLTVDPESETSFDRAPSLDANARRVAFVTNRRGGRTRAVVADVAGGLGCGFGEELGCAEHAALDPSGHRLARICDGAVTVQELDGSLMTVVSAHMGARDVVFSPDGSKLVFASDSGVWVADLHGGGERRVTTDGEAPAWVGSGSLVVERSEPGETDLFAIDLEAGAARRLTPLDGRDAREPWFVGARP